MDISLSAAAASTEAGAASQMANQTFIVGRHHVPPMNKGVVGMCVGETRNIHVTFGGEHGITYFVKLLGIAGGAPRVKPVCEA